MNIFDQWLINNERKQMGVSAKIGVSQATLHNILKKGLMPSLKVAYEIEKYTKGAITVYDWLDQREEPNKTIAKTKPQVKKKKISK
jgi:DNA-binding XRE family transcriptional regulator